MSSHCHLCSDKWCFCPNEPTKADLIEELAALSCPAYRASFAADHRDDDDQLSLIDDRILRLQAAIAKKSQ